MPYTDNQTTLNSPPDDSLKKKNSDPLTWNKKKEILLI